MAIKHAFVSVVADGPAGGVVRPSDWNADHSVEGLQLAHGWPLDATGARYVDVAYDAATQKVTITAKAAAATFDIYTLGAKTTVNSPHVSEAHTKTAGAWHYSFDGTNWNWSQSVWDMRRVSPTCFVYWSTVLDSGVGEYELHSAERNSEWHHWAHDNIGTMLTSGGILGGYTVGTDSDAAIQFSISETEIDDEDIEFILAEKVDGAGFTIWVRSGTSGIWTWTTANALPFLYGTYPQRNYDAGGGTGWTMADVGSTGSGLWSTAYVLATTILDSNHRYIIIPGQSSNSTLLAAQNETISSLSLGTFPLAEACPIAKLIFHAKSNYSGTAKAMLVQVDRLIGQKATITGAAQVPAHNSLTGLQGGTTNEYVHLRQDQIALLDAAGAAVAFASDGVDGDPGPPGRIGTDGTPGLNGTPGGQGLAGPALFFLAETGDEGDRGPPGPTPTPGSITYPLIQNVSATDKVLGRSTAGAGVIEEIACTAAGRAILDDADAAAQRTTLGLGTSAVNAQHLLYVKAGENFSVNSTNNVTIATKDITGVAAGDTFEVEAWFTILNNSTANRVYTLTLDFDGLFAILITTGSTAFSATLIHPFRMKAILDIRASNLAYAMVEAKGYTAAGIASGGTAAMLATSLDTMLWATSTSDATTTTTVSLNVKSANATATQTLRLHRFTIRKSAALSL
jgi:hypothetical protein